MNRLEFLTSLRYNLEKGGLPREDIEDALSYYEEIFLDAGYGSDEQTAQTLGDPETLAKEILIENGIHPEGDASFEVGAAKRAPFEDVQDVAFEEVGKENTEQNGSYNYGYGYTGSENTAHTNNSQYGSSQTSGGIFFDAATKVNQALDGALHSAREAYDRNFNDPTMTAEQRTTRNNSLLKVLLIIVTFPLWIGVVATVGGLLFGLVAALFGIVIALIAGGFSMVIMGIKLLFTVPPAGIMTIGLGMIFLGIFGLVAKPGFAGIRKLAGKFINGFRGLCGKIFG
ncbi:DUF1700 domain-containing protein [Ruminococcus albus]|uniref:DUF1700 domain-containing protein n=1 Tax=Ruminococcus albus TaxID=1264 RepID=A0A1I1I9L3_RUMAL|nr:DUF1700 domain-containing protein [Ruminococcus albus]SFC30473.1 Protein of unknown function [Ruminococcus albus]